MLACSGDLLLEALVACAGVTLRAVATAIEVNINEGMITAEGDLDFRGTLAVSKEAPEGDLVIVMSNGGFDDIHQKLLGALEARGA